MTENVSPQHSFVSSIMETERARVTPDLLVDSPASTIRSVASNSSAATPVQFNHMFNHGCTGDTPRSDSGPELNYFDDPEFALSDEHRAVLYESESLRKTGYLFKAERLVHGLLTALQSLGSQGQAALEIVFRSIPYRELIEELEAVNVLLEALLNDDHWVLAKESTGIHVWTKQEPGIPTLTVRAAGIVKGPLENVVGVGRETELIKTWAPGVKLSCDLGKPVHTFEDLQYYLWKIPFVAGREFVIHRTYWIDDHKRFVLVKLANPSQGMAQVPPEKQGQVRTDIKQWSFYIAPLDGTSVFIVSVMNMDLKMPLPSWIMNYIAVTNGFNVITQLQANVSASLDSKSEFAKRFRLNTNAVFYDRIRAIGEEQRKCGFEKLCPATEEILQTGWLKGVEDRRKLFARDGDDDCPVLVKLVHM